jgi:hypothetical protein
LSAQTQDSRDVSLNLQFESELFAELGPAAVTQAEMDASLAQIPEELRGNFLIDRRRLSERLNQLLFTRLIVEDARANGFFETPEMHAILHELLLADLVVFWREHRHSQIEVDFEALAREQFLADPSQFAVPPTVDFEHILIRTGERSDMETVRKIIELNDRFASGASFNALIEEHSEDDLQPEGGYREIPLEALDPAFADALADAPTDGSLVGPVKTQHGWHLVRLIERRDGGSADWEDVREQAIASVRSDHLERVEARYRDRLLEGHELYMPEGAVEKLYERYDLMQFFEETE